MKLIRTIDRLLNGITMYRLLLYGLGLLAAIGVLFGFTGELSLSGGALLVSCVLLLGICYGVNRALAAVWRVPANAESSLITALILFFILPPASGPGRAVAVVATGIVAVASKYVLAVHRKHVFNPAAIGAVTIGFTGILHATWWVGSSAMLPFTLILGLVVVRKIRRFRMVLSFVGASLAILLLVAATQERANLHTLEQAFTVWPLIFLGTIMLTEPSTLPPRNAERMLYGALVGVIFTSQQHIGAVSSTPEIALVLGNLYSYAISEKYKLRLRLKAKVQLSARVYDFVFEPERRPRFLPGQYMEWTLAHPHADGRGNRRTFSIASSPTEPDIHIGVKFYEPSSSFKQHLLAMQPGDALMAGHIAGDFTLPKNPRQKLAFIAGGIGITPFRSMCKYLIDTDRQRDIVLLYSVSTPDELSYTDILHEAEKHGLRLVPILGAKEIPADWRGRSGFITPELIQQEIPDLGQRTFYISGPNAMVETYAAQLHKMGVAYSRIVTDYFSGY